MFYKFANIFKTKEAPLNLSMMEYIRSWFTKDPDLSGKKKQRDTGVFSIFSQLDIKYVLKKFSEIEKLKMLLLDEDQYHLFEYLPKPTILKNSKIHMNYVKADKQSPVKKGEIIHHTNDLMSKTKEVQRAFRNIKRKTELSEVDRKLIDCLDPDIMRLLEEGELMKSESKMPPPIEFIVESNLDTAKKTEHRIVSAEFDDIEMDEKGERDKKALELK